MRVAVSAFACDPTQGSERGVGWAWAAAAAKRHEVVVFTGEWNRQLIEPVRQAVGLTDVVYVDVERQRIGALGRLKVVGHYYVYTAWQTAVAQAIARMHSERAFDLIHHVTYGAVWLPTYLSQIGAPVVLGPLGGAERVPTGLLGTLGVSGVARELVRTLAQECFGLWRPVRSGIHGARLNLAKTVESERYLRRHGARLTAVETELSIPEWLETGVDQVTQGMAGSTAAEFVCVGRLQEFKGQRLAVEAFAMVRAQIPRARLVLYGAGPDRMHLERKVARLGIADSVHFAGQVSRQATINAMGKATALIHPTLHDSSGNVLVEAMACGLPVICLRIGGPATVVPRTAGIMVEASSRRSTIEDLANAMLRLAEDSALRSELSRAALVYASSRYGAQAFEDRIDCVYRTALYASADTG